MVNDLMDEYEQFARDLEPKLPPEPANYGQWDSRNLSGSLRCPVCGDPSDLDRIAPEDKGTASQDTMRHTLMYKGACMPFHEYPGIAYLWFRRKAGRIMCLDKDGLPTGPGQALAAP